MGLIDQNRHPHLELGRLDRHGQAGIEATGQALVDVHQALRVGVAGHDDVSPLGQQRFEGVEKLLLRALLAGEELHIVNQQQVERMVFGLQLIKGLALVVLHHIGDELLGMQIEHAGVWLVLQQGIADRMDQMRLAQTHAAIDEQRVVHLPWRAGDMQGRSARHLIGAPGHQIVKGQRAVDTVARGTRGRALLRDLVGR